MLFLATALAATALSLNFAFVGGLVAIPRVLWRLQLPVRPGVSLLLATTAEAPGVVAAAYFARLLPPWHCVVLSLVGLFLSIFAFVVAMVWHAKFEGVPVLEAPPAAAYVILSLMAIKMFVSTAFATVYGLTPDCFPQSVRASACAVIVTFGRLGAIIAPPIFDAMRLAFGGDQEYFVGMALVTLSNLLVLLPFRARLETALAVRD